MMINTNLNNRISTASADCTPTDQNNRNSDIPTNTRETATTITDQSSFSARENFNDQIDFEKSGSVEHRRISFNYNEPIIEKTKKELVFDPPPDSVTWRFRTTSDLSRLPESINKTGLANLNISGSAAISSTRQISDIQKTIGNHPLIVFDLRKDPHAAINEHSATWTIPGNWVNLNKSYEAAIQNEQKRINRLKSDAPDQLTLINHDDYKTNSVSPRTITFNKPVVKSEQEIVEQCGAQYIRLGVGDHLRPDDIEIDRFLQALRKIPNDSWLHFHCKGGMGRTTTFMVMYDMLHNAQSVSMNDIIERQRALGQGYDLMGNGNHPERFQFRQDRRELIAGFYQYARENPMGHSKLWSEWCKQQ